MNGVTAAAFLMKLKRQFLPVAARDVINMLAVRITFSNQIRIDIKGKIVLY